MTHRPPNRQGYVLVVTLGLLVLASSLLVGVARLSVQRTLQARFQEQDLRRRWGAISCRTAVLPFAEQILTTQSQAREAPVPTYRIVIQLNDQLFDLVIADEQAKANVNTLIDESNPSTAEDRIRTALSGSGVGGSLVLHPSYLVQRSTPQTAATQPAGPRQWITGLGQIFQALPPGRLIEQMSGVGSSPVDRLTCWGSGAINVMRADAAALKLALSPPLTQLEIDRIVNVRDAMLKSRRSTPTMIATGNTAVPRDADVVTRILAEARVNPKDRAKIALVGVSSCHSLWVVGKDRQRSWHWLFVSDESNPQRPRMDSFQW